MSSIIKIHDLYPLKELFDYYIMPHIKDEPLFYPEAVIMGTALCVIANEKIVGMPTIYTRVLNNYAIPTAFVMEFIDKFEQFIWDTIDHLKYDFNPKVKINIGKCYTIITTELTDDERFSFKMV